MAPTTVLVVDDDPDMADLLATVLGMADYAVTTAGSVTEAREAVRREPPALVLVDLGLPDGSGHELVAHLAARHPEVGIIIVTAEGREDEHVRGLRAGADDVVGKPFRMSTLLARVEAVLRRRGPLASAARTIAIADLEIDVDGVRATRAGTPLDLTPTEFRLLEHLALHAGRVLSKAQLLDEIWGYDFGGDGQVVERFVSTLRRKLGEPDLIRTVRGFGYMLKDPA
ncbi:response regulator transcription factor [Demequina gelatinilytica]|uniref:response regulator transcription factor n=1 Tax=Demequina gelatinilytica TaxID=1638980 RepID=UPI000780C0E4|nr:response regulator transcription factor [Demequina gelatinilytica]